MMKNKIPISQSSGERGVFAVRCESELGTAALTAFPVLKAVNQKDAIPC